MLLEPILLEAALTAIFDLEVLAFRTGEGADELAVDELLAVEAVLLEDILNALDVFTVDL